MALFRKLNYLPSILLTELFCFYLAIEGATPVREEFLPFGRPRLGQEEARKLLDTLESRWIGAGPKADQFEAMFAEYVHSQHALAVNSCTAALHYRALHAYPFYRETYGYQPRDFPQAGNVGTVS